MYIVTGCAVIHKRLTNLFKYNYRHKHFLFSLSLALSFFTSNYHQIFFFIFFSFENLQQKNVALNVLSSILLYPWLTHRCQRQRLANHCVYSIPQSSRVFPSATNNNYSLINCQKCAFRVNALKKIPRLLSKRKNQWTQLIFHATCINKHWNAFCICTKIIRTPSPPKSLKLCYLC